MSIQYSNEIINAFIDSELDGIEKEDFKKAMSEDKLLSDRVNELCELKQSIHLSYSDINESANTSGSAINRNHNRLYKYSSVAMIFLSIGLFFGWACHATITQSLNLTNSQQQINGVKLSPVSLQQSNRIILHVASSKPEKMEATLNKIEKILSEYQQNQLPFELEIIANAGGIDLLRKDTSPYKEKIEAIMQANNNVSFIACSNTLEKLKNLGIKPDLIANTKSNFTAVEKIVGRLQQGWVYLKV